MKRKEIETAVVGAGQAGVCLSHYLSRSGIEHAVFERDKPFMSWRNRWDGFRTNTPNWMNVLPFPNPQAPLSNEANGFVTRDELVAYLDACLATIPKRIATNTEVTLVERRNDGKWRVEAGGEEYVARSVAVCNGAMSAPRLPPSATDLPSTVPQLHSSRYRSPDQITTKAVLVVGTASSGVQITRLLCESGKFDRIHVSLSKVLVLPKHILGIPIHRVIHGFGLFDATTTSLLGRLMYSGLETRGDPIMRPTPQDLAKEHALDLRGRFVGVDGRTIRFSDGSSLSTDDLTVIWCTGFRPDYPFLKVADRDAAFHPTGHAKHVRGVSQALPGLFFVGLRYQHTVASHDIYGVARDAEYVAGAIKSHLAPQPERGQMDA